MNRWEDVAVGVVLVAVVAAVFGVALLVAAS